MVFILENLIQMENNVLVTREQSFNVRFRFLVCCASYKLHVQEEKVFAFVCESDRGRYASLMSLSWKRTSL